MRIVSVKFKGSNKSYEYQTELPLITGGEYKIVADGVTSYSTNIVVEGYKKKAVYDGPLRVITNASCVNAPRMEDDNIENVFFNKEKRTTVVKWKDGVITKVTCNEADQFDKEKALALCYMKRYFKNRGAFNKVIQHYCEV